MWSINTSSEGNLRDEPARWPGLNKTNRVAPVPHTDTPLGAGKTGNRSRNAEEIGLHGGMDFKPCFLKWGNDNDFREIFPS